MIAKLGLVLLVAAFGALMFVAGVLAPGPVRAPFEALIGLAPSAMFKPEAKGAEKGASPPVAAKEEDPVPWGELVVPTPAPQKAQYALQLGQYASKSEAESLAARGEALGLPYAVIAVVDASGARWWVGALGKFASVDEARAARWKVSQQLGLSELLPAIRLPAVKPAAKPAA